MQIEKCASTFESDLIEQFVSWYCVPRSLKNLTCTVQCLLKHVQQRILETEAQSVRTIVPLLFYSAFIESHFPWGIWRDTVLTNWIDILNLTHAVTVYLCPLHQIFVWVVDSTSILSTTACKLHGGERVHHSWLGTNGIAILTRRQVQLGKAKLKLVLLSSDTVHYSPATQYVASTVESMMVKEHTADYRSWWMGLTSPLWLQSIHQEL